MFGSVFDEKVQVAAIGVEVAAHSRAKQLEPSDSKLLASRCHCLKSVRHERVQQPVDN